MAVSASSAVSAGLAQVAHMGRRERERVLRRLRRQNPAFDQMLAQVDRCRVVAFASGLVLLLAVVFLAGGEPVWLAGAMVITGLSGFGTVSVRMTDSRFDLLLAVLGEHWAEQLRTEEVADQLVDEQQRFPCEGDGIPQARRADEHGPSTYAC
jgi:hypothetical protein